MRFVHTADTHLGFEFTKIAQCHPQGRRKRAQSVFDNFLRIVSHTIDIEADLFIHSGDLLNKHYIPRGALDELIRPIQDLTRAGIPVVLIPGNHERSKFPYDLFHGISRVFVFDEPKTLSFNLGGYSVGVAGFPFIRRESRRTFLKALTQTGYREVTSDFNILVTHQAFDEASVGPTDFVFGAGRPDTVLRQSCPTDFEYIAAGHIHRYQILEHPAKPRLNFVYPGSIQKMSFAEMHEEKGFVEGELVGDRIETRFIPLPSFEMEIVQLDTAGMMAQECEHAIRGQFWRFGADVVIRFNLTGGRAFGDYPDIDFAKLRTEMPPVLECQFALRTGKGWLLK